ncbi:GTPase-activating protein [Rhodopirellula sp. JC740]|uniref:GTPase-activating protein n=1 Tax=Rhodopirellula halodulae TaxID=2894198 RepID=A0ABS8NBW0_9BACT|nr:GTPase-activating protein [Rhodopirellula sp. JC740]
MSEKRQRLAALLIATSLSTSACLSSRAVLADGPAFASPTLSAPAFETPSEDGHANDAIEPRVAGPAIVIRENADSTRSHLQFRSPVQPAHPGAGPMGSAIQLLPPQQAAPAMEAPVFLGNAEAKSSEEIVKTPNFVTRENARLNGVRKSWAPEGPLFTSAEPSMVLRGPEAKPPVDDVEVPRHIAERDSDSIDNMELPPEFQQVPMRSVSDRVGSGLSVRPSTPAVGTGTPSTGPWIARQQVDRVSPLRDPEPSTTMEPIGSGTLPRRSLQVQPSPTEPTPSLTAPRSTPTAQDGFAPRANSPTPMSDFSDLPALPDGPMESLRAPAMNEEFQDLPQKVDDLSSKLDALTEKLNALTAQKPAAPTQPAPSVTNRPKKTTPSAELTPLKSATDSLPDMKPPSNVEELPSLKDAKSDSGNAIGSGVQGGLSLEAPKTRLETKSDGGEAEQPKAVAKKANSDALLNESIAEQLRREESFDRSQMQRREAGMELEAASPRRSASSDSVTRSEKVDPEQVSRVPLKSLDQNRLTPLKDAPSGSVQLKDIRGRGLDDNDLQELYAGETESEKEVDPAEEQRLRLAQLDATGRPKTHDGQGAAPNLSTGVMRMKQPITQCLQYYYARPEKADGRSNWGMMHAVMVYGPDTRLIARGRDYSTIAWMAGNNVCRGQRLMEVDRGKIKAKEGVGLQGHQAQWLAVLAMAGVPSDYPLYADGQKFSVADLVKAEAAACKEGEELTFSLIGLSHYLDTETTWKTADGERWDFERLIAAELDQPVVGSACGGTHRLMGFAHALRKRRMEGRPVEGQWLRAEKFLDDFVDYTLRLQNRDGSMSTDWFESRQDNGDLDRKVQTTGHMVEFLLTHLPDEKLLEPEVLRSVTFLLNAMLKGRNNDWSIGPKGHALRSLALFHQRVYGEPAALTNQRNVARQRQATRRSR